MENSSRLGSEDQWKPASILEENVGRKENFGSTRKGIKEHEQSEKCLKEEINSNRKINNQILGAEKEVERVVVVVECSADCRNTTRQRVGRAPLPPLQLLLLLLWYKKLNGWPSNSLKEVSHDLL